MLPLLIGVSLLFALYGCEWNGQPQAAGMRTDNSPTAGGENQNPPGKKPLQADAASILAKPQVPILCYHQIRDFRASDSKVDKNYIVPPAHFREQMKMLHDSGYTSILPDQLMDYLLRGKPLPPKPVMLTFDDADEDQYAVALPELNKYGFKGVFFIMTVVLNKPHYMSVEQVRQLAAQGNVIGSHTWDHHNVKKYSGKDWVIQLDKPLAELTRITGKPIKYFAYPFGLWNREAFPELKKRGFVSAFQLTARRDEQDPLYTVRRMIVPGTWSTPLMHASMKRIF